MAEVPTPSRAGKRLPVSILRNGRSGMRGTHRRANGMDEMGQAVSFRDKDGRLTRATSGTPIELELGCGIKRLHPTAVGVDVLDHTCVDVVGDVMDVLATIPDGAVSAAYSNHFLEHVDDVIALIKELARVVMSGGVVETIVPHFSNPHFYSDPTHRAAFGLYSFSYLAKDPLFRRNVPNYFGTPDFTLTDCHLYFRTERPFYLRHAVGKVVERVVNRRPFSAEKYERWWCYVWPAYEVKYVITRN